MIAAMMTTDLIRNTEYC